MNVAFQRNLGSFIRSLPALAHQQVTAGGGADGVAQDGLTIDRESLDQNVLSALAVVHIETALTAGQSAQVNIAVQDSADGTTWATYDPGPPDDYAATVITDDGHFCATRKIQLGGARRYVRIRPTITMSNNATDTADIDGTFIVGGSDELPMSAVDFGGGESS